MGLGVLLYVNHTGTQRVTQASGAAVEGVARAVGQALGESLGEREREIALLAQMPVMVREALDGDTVRKVLEQRQRSWRPFAWIGVTDPAGTVRNATGGLLEGVNVAQRPWFAQGLRGSWVGDVHEAVLLAQKLQAPDAPEPLRFVDFVAPIHDEAGRLRGVLATHVDWTWVAQTVHAALPRNAAQHGLEVFVARRDGAILYPFHLIGRAHLPAALPAQDGFARIEWGSDGAFLAGVHALHPAIGTDLGWRVVVRQPLEQALAPVAALHRELIALGVLATALFGLLAYRLASGFSRPVEALAATARRIAQGEERTPFPPPGPVHEFAVLTAALHEMTASLIARQEEIEAANRRTREALERQLRGQEALNEAIVHASSNGLLLYRGDGQCVLANAAAADIVGAPVEVLLQQNFHTLGTWRESGLYEAAVQGLDGITAQCLVSATSSFGKPLDCLATVVPLRHDGQAMVLVVMKDVSELMAANRELEQLARHDALTRVPNRLAANERLRAEFLRLKRSGSAYAVLLIDIDHFKRVNDHFGHETGDAVLHQVAALLADSVRITDFVARFGGEEFLVLLPDTDSAGALVSAEKLRDAVAQAAVPLVGQVTLSIGVSGAQPSDASEDDAVRRADRALYRAKAAGRNQVMPAQAETKDAAQD